MNINAGKKQLRLSAEDYTFVLSDTRIGIFDRSTTTVAVAR
jgi:hypothetical protein